MQVTQADAQAFLDQHEHELSGLGRDAIENLIHCELGGTEARQRAAAAVMINYGWYTRDGHRSWSGGKIRSVLEQQSIDLKRV